MMLMTDDHAQHGMLTAGEFCPWWGPTHQEPHQTPGGLPTSWNPSSPSRCDFCHLQEGGLNWGAQKSPPPKNRPARGPYY
eukprot:8171367-Pyramimonas_sp.AAC.2